MRRSLVLVALLAAGCSQSPTAPTYTPPDVTGPSFLTMGMIIGSGVHAGSANITAKVQAGTGAPLSGAVVGFTTDVGTLSAATAATGVDGIATVVLTSTALATVTAHIGTLTAKTLVTAQPPPPQPPPDVPPVLLPPPTPPVPPTPQPGYVVTVTPAASSVIAGNPLTLNATVIPINGATAPTTFVWDCLGNGPTVTTASPTTSCLYPVAGSITSRLNVTVGGVGGGNSTVVKVLPGLVASVSCAPVTPAVAGTLACSANVSYGGVGEPSSVISGTTWDWGDNSPTAPGGTTNTASHKYLTGGQTLPVIATVTATIGTSTWTAVGTATVTTPP